MSHRLSRRRYVIGTGTVVTLGGLAGCADSDEGNGDVSDDVPAELDEFLADARLYDGTIAVRTDEDEVTVDVGGGPDGLAFDPPALRIDAGTTVRWEWTGEGGEHNVVSTPESDSEFSSGDSAAEAGTTFEHAFDEAGIQLYECEPHRGVNMLGGIHVVD